MPHLYVIAGPNGAGKTTFAQEYLPHFAHCPVFVNADLIAKDLLPNSPERAAVTAGRLMLKRIRQLSSAKKDFGFETTLSGRSYHIFFRHLIKSGYEIRLFFLWLPDVNLAIQRVRDRVSLGGHSIPEDVIRRRFNRGLRQFWTHYQDLLKDWVILDNSGRKPIEVANRVKGQSTIIDSDLFKRLQRQMEKS